MLHSYSQRGKSCVIIYTEFTEKDAFRMQTRLFMLEKLIEFICLILKTFQLKKDINNLEKSIKRNASSMQNITDL